MSVLLAHRLLKNGLTGRRAYILLTDAALRWAGVDPAPAGLIAHTERYEHFGEVRYFVRGFGMAGPEMAPQTPQPSERAGEAVALLP